jgi:hypothetical protein
MIKAEEFILRRALYVTEPVDGFEPPARVNFRCEGECKKETTWFPVPVNSPPRESVCPKTVLISLRPLRAEDSNGFL